MIEFDYPNAPTFTGQSYERVRRKIHRKDSAKVKRKYPDQRSRNVKDI